MGGPYGLDMGAVMMVAQARGVDTGFLAEVLPSLERVIITAMDDEDEGG